MDEKQKFIAYERVRRSGITNMYDLKTVINLTGLSKEDIINIMKNYTYLNEKYENEV